MFTSYNKKIKIKSMWSLLQYCYAVFIRLSSHSSRIKN